MIILLDTSTPTCRLAFAENEEVTHQFEWESGRTLAKELLGYIHDKLHSVSKSWNDISGIVMFRGPGSFTGLRIGITVVNTFADSESIPIVGVMGEHWQADGLGRLKRGDNDQLVLPEYGGEANITTPRK